jgi:outer membrane protein assembly factor BamD (BamD/ComL family)
VRAPQVQVLVADSYFSRRMYLEALTAYQTLLARYPSVEVEKVRYQIGLSYEGLNDWILTKLNLEKFIQTYPESAYVDAAGEKLRAIDAHRSAVKGQDCDCIAQDEMRRNRPEIN